MSSESDSIPAAGGSQGMAIAMERAGEGRTLTYDISRGKVLVRLLKNKIFGLLTLGIYRFWGKTYLRQLLWQGLKIGTDRLEYRGTAKELFIGFLIALIILLPLFLLTSFAIELLALLNETVAIFSQLLNFLLLYTLWQFARYRLWRYRLSRTAWRGIRFFLSGRATLYAWNVLIRTIASLVTLGWAYPWLRSYRLQYQLNNTHFGDGRFTYAGQTAGLYKLYWPAILITQLVVAGGLGYLATSDVMTFSTEAITAIGDGKAAMAAEDLGPVYLGGFIIIFALTVFMFVTRVWEFRYMAANTSFMGARFSSSLRLRSVLVIFLFLFLLSLVSMIAFGVVIALVIMWQSALAAILPFIFLLIAWIGIDILKTLFFLVPLVKAICKSTEIDTLAPFEEAAANAEKSPSYGEGFADAMDVGAF
ncbi:MAG: hypothetical protein CMN56_12180 [Sneathiella sp.]|uniref:DUF898 family protein n=1 Tax=Sneathiella sp. TaxID=1964365 RepID=UPI000C4A147A|nr:DUF898 family protein [Sneathiella sp.]MAZ03887.1 hypothetical protein [Sneathiella sp.]